MSDLPANAFPTFNWIGPANVDGLASRFHSTLTSSAIANREPIALKYLMLGALLSWRKGEPVDSIFMYNDPSGRQEVFQLTRYGTLHGFFLDLTTNLARAEPIWLNMDHLANSIVQRMNWLQPRVHEMIGEEMRMWKYMTFDEQGSMRIDQVRVEPQFTNLLVPNGRVFERFEPLTEDVNLATLNPLFSGKLDPGHESFTSLKKNLERCWIHFQSIPQLAPEPANFLDFVHGVLITKADGLSIRIHRPGVHGDLAIGMQDPLLEHFSLILYLHQYRGNEYKPSSFTKPHSWKTFADSCIYVEIVPLPTGLETTASPMSVKNPALSNNSPLARFEALDSDPNVYWPEAILGEIMVRKNYDNVLSKQVFKPNRNPSQSRRFSFACASSDGRRVLLNVIEHDHIPQQLPSPRYPTTVPQFLAHQNYEVFELHVQSPDDARHQVRQSPVFLYRGRSSEFEIEDGTTIDLARKLDGTEIAKNLFTDPLNTIPQIERVAKEIMPTYNWWLDRTMSVLKGVFSSDIGVKYNTFLDDSNIHIFRAGFVDEGLILRKTEKTWLKHVDDEARNVESSVKRHLQMIGLDRLVSRPRVIMLRIFGNRHGTPVVAYNFADGSCSSKPRYKRAVTCDYAETTEDESYKERLLEEEKFVERFKSFEKLRYLYQKEHFRETSSSRSFERATKWSNALMNLQMGKNILGSMIKGDWAGVAFNTGFLIGGAALSTFGAELTGVGQMYRSVGRAALGNAMLVGGPILSRLPSVLILFDFFKQWRDFQNGDEGATVGVFADGAAIANEATATLIEILSEMGVAGLSWPAAPIGALIFLGVDIYNTVRVVRRIDEKLHLSKGEKVGEFFLAFLGIPPTSYMQHLLDEKNMNDRNMDDLSKRFTCSKDVAFYAQPSQWVKDTCKQKCVAPMIFYPSVSEICGERTCEYTVHNSLNNMADFRAKVNMFSRAFPKTVDNVELQCSSATGHRETGKDESRYMFKCTNMMSVKIENATSQMSFIEIGSGNDIIYSYEEVSNVVRMSGGQKNVIGGSRPDIFILYGNQPIVGTIDGSGGVDELNLQSHEIKASLIVKPVENTTDLQMTSNFDGSLSEALYLKNIEKIVGRSGQQEIVHIGCNLKEIDLKGGSNGREDKIIIDGNEHCPETLTMLIEGPFNIENRAKSGKFRYIVRSGHKQQSIHLATDEDVLNWIAFNYSLADVSEIVHIHRENTAEGETLQKRLQNIRFFHPDGIEEPQTWVSFASESTNMQFLFTDNVTLVHKGSMLIGYKEMLEGQVDDLIRRYRTVANSQHLHLVFDIRNKMKVFMGHGTYKNITLQQALNDQTSTNAPINIMTNDFTSESHLVSETTENLFLIRANTSKPPLSFSCFMKPTIIHYSPGMKNSTIDLSDLALKHVNSSAKLSLKLMFSDFEDDTTLILGTLHSSTGRENLFGTITLKNFSSDVLKTLITVKTNDNVFWIDTETRSFKSKPVHFDEKTEVIILRPEDNIDHLSISDQIDESTFIKCNESLTMMYDVAGGRSKKTITLLSYFNSTTDQREKFNALQFDFKNRSFVLSDELQRSLDFYDMC